MCLAPSFACPLHYASREDLMFVHYPSDAIPTQDPDEGGKPYPPRRKRLLPHPSTSPPPSRLRVPPIFCLTRRREDAKSLVEMHAIEVKGNRHLTFLPATRAFQAYEQGQPHRPIRVIPARDLLSLPGEEISQSYYYCYYYYYYCY
jgi:hypothetical protein